MGILCLILIVVALSQTLAWLQGGGEEGGGAKEKPKKEKRLKNQFNFSERASQTLNNPARVR